MNREILFRGKRIDNGEWVIGDLRQYTFISDDCEDFYEIDTMSATIGYGHSYKVDRDSIGQYTGLTDSKGNKIFDGDILQEYWFGKHNVLGVVEYGAGTFDSGHYRYTGFYYRDKRGDVDHTNLHPMLIKEYGIEVIGNIYDNPELLTDKQ